MHEPHAYSQLQGNIIKHIRQDVSRQSFQKFPVHRPRQLIGGGEYPGKVCDIGFESRDMIRASSVFTEVTGELGPRGGGGMFLW
jgi:hypothetical protein